MTYERFCQLVNLVADQAALGAYADRDNRPEVMSQYETAEAAAKQELLNWAASRELK